MKDFLGQGSDTGDQLAQLLRVEAPPKLFEPNQFGVQSSEFILVKNDKLTRKALTEPLPANDGTQPLPTQTYECTCATNPGVLRCSPPQPPHS